MSGKTVLLRWQRRGLIAAVLCVISMLFALPLVVLLGGGIAAAVSGFLFLSLFAFIQVPLLLLLRFNKQFGATTWGLPTRAVSESTVVAAAKN
ncbi:MAG: hypothetical protein WAO83_02345 [Fuerstiella sp.]